MRVVILPSWYPSYEGDWDGIFFREQASALARYGVHVDVVSPRRVSLRNLHKLPASLSPVPNLKEHRLTYIGLPRAQRLDEFLWRTASNILYKRYIVENGVPDVLHVHSIEPAGYLGATLPARIRVITEHSSAFLSNRSQELANKSWQTFSKYEIRIAVSQHLSETIARLAPQGGSWTYVPNLIDTEHFRPRNVGSTPPKLLTISNLIPSKRVDWVIRAFDYAHSDTDCELLIGGSGSERTFLEKLASSLKSANRIHFLGSLSRDQVREQLDRCTVFALASRLETFGVVLIEALSMGRPVVATNSGGPASIINSKNGLLVDLDDFDGFAQAIKDAFTTIANFDPSRIRLDCERRFSEHAVASQLVALYEHALSDVCASV